MCKKFRELRAYCFKGEPLSSVHLRFAHNRFAQAWIFQQLEGHGSDFADRSSFTAGFGKRNSVNCAVAAAAWNPAEKRIACNMARDMTTIELQHNLMSGYIAQVIPVRL